MIISLEVFNGGSIIFTSVTTEDNANAPKAQSIDSINDQLQNELEKFEDKSLSR